jgi:hypothetical protein
MRDEAFWDFNFIPQDLGSLVRILLPAIIAAHTQRSIYLWKWRISVCLSERDLMRVRRVVLVMEALILADNDPKIVCGVDHVPSKFPKNPEKLLDSHSHSRRNNM